jgi:hypothetical protein
MKTPPQPPVGTVISASWLPYYAIARRIGEAIYDESWVVPDGDFVNWRRGQRKPRRRRARTWKGTLFDRLVKLSVLRKIDGPIPPEPNATPLDQINFPDCTYDGRDYEP